MLSTERSIHIKKSEYISLESYLRAHSESNCIFDTNWYAISGAPCSGKTTIINKLAEKGFDINPDIARMHIEGEINEGLTKIQVRSNLKYFRRIVFLKMFKNVTTLPINKCIFHDYALPDNISFYKVDKIARTLDLYKSINMYRFKKIFILDPLPYFQDNVRIENKSYQIRMDQEMRNTYKILGYDIVSIPVMSIQDRITKILNHI